MQGLSQYTVDPPNSRGAYELCSRTFKQHRSDLDQHFPKGRMGGKRLIISPNQFSYAQVLVYQGPGSLPDLKSPMELKEGSLLEIMRACRRKLASDAKDKLFGILGILPDEVRDEFRADYSLSVKDVYTEVVDFSSRRSSACMLSAMPFISQPIQARLIYRHSLLTGHTPLK